MTIDEAIAHAREVAKEKRNEHYTFGIQKSKEVAEEYKQLVEWLEELKAIKSDGFTDDLLNMGFTKGYNKAIDDFVENISLEISESLIWGMIADCFKYKNMNDTSDKIVDYVINTANEIAEKLKAGGTV